MTPFIKKTVLGSLITVGVLVAVVFVFGSTDPLDYSLPQNRRVPRFESVSELLPQRHVTSLNATRELATEIAAELIAQNPDGPQASEDGTRQIASINPEELAERAIEDVFSKVKVEDLRPRLTTADITIVKTSEHSFETAYFNAVNAIFVSRFPEGTLLADSSSSKAELSRLIAAFDSATADLKATPTPQTLSSMHLELITLMSAERNALVLIKNFELDPAQATIAIEAGDRFTGELEKLFDTMDAYIFKNKLVLTAL